MGLENRNQNKFITIFNGKFCIRVPQGTPDSVERVNKLGNTVHELYYDSFTGILQNIRITDSTYGKSWNFDFIDDSGEQYSLQLSYSNNFATQFLKMLPNIDLSKEFKLSPSTKVEDGKTKSSLFINQNGQTIKHAFTKDNPNGIPQLEKKIIKGNEVWDDTEILAFLENMVAEKITPQLAKNKNVSQETVSIDSFDTPTEATDEAPF